MPLTDAIRVLSETALHDYLEMGLVVALPVELDVQMAPFGLLLRKGEHISREWGCSSNCCVEKSRFFDSLVSF
jgi:hypothetical protein